MSSNEYFSELNIQRLKVCAYKWALQHPVIKKLLLCACAEAGLKYVLLMEDPKLPKKNPKRTRYNRDSEPIYTDATKEDPLFFDKINLFNWTSEDCLHIREDLSTVYKNEDRFDLHNWMWWNLEEDEDLPEFIVKEFIFKLYERKESIGLPNDSKKLRSNQKHKSEYRKIAAKIWERDPTITIADMIYRDELAKISAPKTYNEKTVRNWIKDLCPDRSHGRRPKKK